MDGRFVPEKVVTLSLAREMDAITCHVCVAITLIGPRLVDGYPKLLFDHEAIEGTCAGSTCLSSS